MPITVSKEFRWEMGHRLPYHETCKNIHGHSYRLVVEITGEPDSFGMVIDFGDISKQLKPIIDQLDHSFMVDPNDDFMLQTLHASQLKATKVEFLSTAENIVNWIANEISSSFFEKPNVESLTLTLFETVSSSAKMCIHRG